VGFDPSLRNWGVAVGYLDTTTQNLTIDDLTVIQPIISTGKQLRVNSKDLEAAHQLYRDAISATQGAHAIFVEVPVGSQSAQTGRVAQ